MRRRTAAILIALFLACVPARAAVETTTVTGKIFLPGGTTATAGAITCILSAAGSTEDAGVTQRVAARTSGTISAAGAVTGLALVPNDAITPSGTYYTCTTSISAPLPSSWTEKWSVTTAPDPVEIGDIQRLDVPAGAAGLVTKEGGATVCSPTGSLDFGAGFDLAKVGYECDVAFDVTEVAIPFSAITTGTNTSATMALSGGSASLTASGGATIRATDVNCAGGCIVQSEMFITTAHNDPTYLDLDDLCVGTPTNNQVCAYQSATNDHRWISAAGGGNSFETMNAPSGTDPVADSPTDTLNLSATSPVTITGDSTTDTLTVALSTVPVSSGGTGATDAGNARVNLNLPSALTDDATLVGDGANYAAKVLPDCDATARFLQYDTATNTFTCPAAISSRFWISTLLQGSSGAGVAVDECIQYRAIVPFRLPSMVDIRWNTSSNNANAVCGLGLYSADGTTKIWSVQGIACGSSGQKAATIGATSIEAGQYVMQVCADVAAVTYSGVAGIVNFEGSTGSQVCTDCATTMPGSVTLATGTATANLPVVIVSD